MLEQFIHDGQLYAHHNIVVGHTRVQTNWKLTLFTIPFRQIVNKKIEYYFFCFDRLGMTLYQYENMTFFGPIIFIGWQELSDFKIKKRLLEIELSFVYKDEHYHMMITRFMRNELWIEQNVQYLLENHFFSK